MWKSQIWSLIWIVFLLDSVISRPVRKSFSHPARWNGWGQYPSLIQATAQQLTAGLKSGQFTSVDLVKAYLLRIAEVNGTLHAVTEVNPDALDIAMELDAERARGIVRGPLHGLPILVKNNIATYDRMNTDAGSYALLGSKVPMDATVVAKLRAAGAIILGKTNLSEWANWRSTNSSDGWAAIGGQVYGPYLPDQWPNGSSSGSGVASTLGLAFASLGTETEGSIISPAGANNIVGIKPTVGLTSRYLTIPVSQHQDTVGPLARTVMDAALVLQAMAGVDPNDNYTSAIPNDGIIPDYVAACNISALAGARIGIPRNAIMLVANETLGWAPRLAAFEKAITVLRDAGAVIVENTNFTAAEEYLNSTSQTQVLNADFLMDLANYLALLTENPNKLKSLADVRAYTQSDPREDYPNRNTGVWDEALDQGWNNTDPRFWIAYQRDLYFGGEGGVLGAIARNNLDAVILPTDRSPPWTSIVGSPQITVPLGVTPPNTTTVTDSRGLTDSGPNFPFGISFLGAKWSESKLIGYAYAFEQRTNVRAQNHPEVYPTTELADVVASRHE